MRKVTLLENRIGVLYNTVGANWGAEYRKFGGTIAKQVIGLELNNA